MKTNEIEHRYLLIFNLNELLAGFGLIHDKSRENMRFYESLFKWLIINISIIDIQFVMERHFACLLDTGNYRIYT